MKLISMTDFVLEQGATHNTDSQFADKVIAYAHFLKQPLTLGMFVPCDENGNFLEQPCVVMNIKGYSDCACREFIKAK